MIRAIAIADMVVFIVLGLYAIVTVALDRR